MSLPQLRLPLPDWRKLQRESFISMDTLADFLQLTDSQRNELSSFSSFPFLLPRRLAEKIKKQDLTDPLFLQFVPLKSPIPPSENFLKDPVSDVSFCKTSKFLKKYKERALLLVTSACAMHCRYCFRQNFPYDTSKSDFLPEIEQIRIDSSLREIILSGGDPLSLGNEQLASLLGMLDLIPHLKRLRFHTRFPIGIPERIDDEFLDILKSIRLQIWFVIHCNHPNELDDDVLKALNRIISLGIPVLNQSVLLKNVNDNVSTLHALFETLVDNGIQPYYLHQLDPVSGSEAFEVPDHVGKQLIAELRSLLPGYGVPLFVKEVPHQLSKSPL